MAQKNSWNEECADECDQKYTQNENRASSPPAAVDERSSTAMDSAKNTENVDDRSKNVFLLDSGASDHMVWCQEWLEDCHDIQPRGIVLGDGNRVCATHRGKLVLKTTEGYENDQNERRLVLRGILCVPDLHSNLKSCSKLCERGYSINIGRDRCNGMYEGVMQFEGIRFQGVYRVIGPPVYPSQQSACVALFQKRKKGNNEDSDGSSIKLWNARLGHAKVDSIKELSRIGVVRGLDFKTRKSNNGYCWSCVKGKHTKESLRMNNSSSGDRCAVVHKDVGGPMSVPSFSGSRYLVSFIDELTGYI